MSNRTGDNGMVKIRKETNKGTAPDLGGREDGAEVRHLDPGGIRD